MVGWKSCVRKTLPLKERLEKKNPSYLFEACMLIYCPGCILSVSWHRSLSKTVRQMASVNLATPNKNWQYQPLKTRTVFSEFRSWKHYFYTVVASKMVLQVAWPVLWICHWHQRKKWSRQRKQESFLLLTLNSPPPDYTNIPKYWPPPTFPLHEYRALYHPPLHDCNQWAERWVLERRPWERCRERWTDLDHRWTAPLRSQSWPGGLFRWGQGAGVRCREVSLRTSEFVTCVHDRLL